MAGRDVFVGYCIPPIFEGLMHAPFVASLMRMMSYDAEHNQRVAFWGLASSGYIPKARTYAVQQFLSQPAEIEWMLFLDWDMIWNPDALDRLLEVADPVEHPIVGGLYFIRMEDGQVHPGWAEWNPDGSGPKNVQTVVAGELRELAWTSMGVTLIHRSVFEALLERRAEQIAGVNERLAEGDPRLRELLRQLGFDPSAGDEWPWYGHDLRWGGRLGEDATFCIRAQEAGFKVWGYAGVVCDHMKTEIIGWKSFGSAAARGDVRQAVDYLTLWKDGVLHHLEGCRAIEEGEDGVCTCGVASLALALEAEKQRYPELIVDMQEAATRSGGTTT